MITDILHSQIKKLLHVIIPIIKQLIHFQFVLHHIYTLVWWCISRLFLKFIYQSISNIIILKNNVEMIRGYSESAFNVVFWQVADCNPSIINQSFRYSNWSTTLSLFLRLKTIYLISFLFCFSFFLFIFEIYTEIITLIHQAKKT